MPACLARPACYRQHDRIGWINRATRQVTKERRLGQLLDALQAGGVYMKMEHAPAMQR